MDLSESMLKNTSLENQLEPCYILRPLGYYLSFLWIIGTSLNGSILYIFIRNKKLRQSSTNLFIAGLILADFIGAFFEIPLPAIALLKCRWMFTYVGCVLESIVAYFAGCSNMYMLCVISIDRYFVIKRSLFARILTIKQTYLIILSAYMLALFWTLMPVIGWSYYDYEGTGASCSIKWEERSLNVISYNITILICVYLIPVTIIILTNLKVFQEIRHRRCRTNINLSRSHIRNQFLIERRIAYTVIFIIGGFLLAWTPYAITVFIRIFIAEQFVPPIIATLPALFAKTSVVWNPLIYIVRNGNFRVYLPFCTNRRLEQRRRTPEVTRFSIYPYATVHLPLPSRLNFPEK